MSMVCFLCDNKFSCGEKSYCLFDNRVCEETGQVHPSISVLLGLTVSQTLDPNNIHSKMLCDKCTSLLYIYEEIYEEYIRLKSKIIDMYNQTAKIYMTNIEYNEIDEEPKALINCSIIVPDNVHKDEEVVDFKLSHNEDVSYEEIIEDDNIFYNSDSEKDEFPVSIDLEENDDNMLTERVETIQIDNENSIDLNVTNSASDEVKSIVKPRYEKRFSCDLCGVNFAHRKNLSTHKRTLHFNGKTYKCDECDCCFSRKIHLECHIRSSHTGEKPFVCSICNASFAYPHIYVRHLKIHSNIKYSCEICGKTFNSRDNRNAHSFIHSQKKRYECFDCGQGFMQKSLLKNHVQIMGHKNVIVVNQPPIKSHLNDERTIVVL